MPRGSFRGRLFLLLMLFAAAPSIMMTLVGYYLVVGTPSQDTTGDQTALQRISDYYGTVIYQDLQNRLDAYKLNGDTDGLNFVLVVSDDGVSLPYADSSFARETVGIITLTAQTRTHGLTEAGGRLYQYVAAPDHGHLLTIGGIVHDSAFSALVDEIKISGARTTTQRELRGRYVVFVGGLFLTVMILTLLSAWYFSSRSSKRLAGPLTALTQASEQIARGEFNKTVKIEAEGEIGRLVDSFNRMVMRLDAATARLTQTERVAAWRQVARRFAHELKNPLQPILVSLYRIEKQLADTPQWEQVREPLKAASDEVKHLTELAERFSGLAKLPPPKIVPINLKAVVCTIAELYKEKLQPFRFAVVLPDEDVTVFFDETYLREAVHNLLQNAADACREDDAIAIEIVDQSEQVLLTVRDSGRGMDVATLAEARLPYFTTKQKGTGLGLAIVDKFMTELGGRLRVESAPGKGTTATLVLPKDSADAS